MSINIQEVAQADEATASLFDMIEEFSKELDLIVNNIKKDDTSRQREKGDTIHIDNNKMCGPKEGDVKGESDSDDEMSQEKITNELSKTLNDLKADSNISVRINDTHTIPSTQPIDISTFPLSSSMTTTIFKDLTIDVDSPLVTQSLSTPSTPNSDKHSLHSSPSNENYSKADKEDEGVVLPRRLLNDAETDEEELKDNNPIVANTWGIANWMTKAKGLMTNQTFPGDQYKKLSKENGSIEIIIAAGVVNKIPFFVPKGKSIMWSTAIKQYDINFSVAVRVQEMGGAIEQEVEPVTKLYADDNTVAIGYRKSCDIDRYLLFIFDNSYSKLRSKNILYKITVGKVADVEIEDYILELEEVEKDKQIHATNSTSTKPYISRATISDARLLFQLSKQVLNTVVNNAQLLASDVAVKASSVVKDTVFTKLSDNMRSIDTVSLNDYDNDEEEGQFVHSTKSITSVNSVNNSPKRRITIHPNAMIEPGQYQDNYAIIVDSERFVTVKLLVTPTDSKAIGFPTVQLPKHYSDNCIYQVNATITPNGVRVYSYAEGFSSQHPAKILCFIESYCFKILQNDDMVLDRNQDLWELHLGFKVVTIIYNIIITLTISLLDNTKRVHHRFYETFEIKFIVFKYAISVSG